MVCPLCKSVLPKSWQGPTCPSCHKPIAASGICQRCNRPIDDHSLKGETIQCPVMSR